MAICDLLSQHPLGSWISKKATVMRTHRVFPPPKQWQVKVDRNPSPKTKGSWWPLLLGGEAPQSILNMALQPSMAMSLSIPQCSEQTLKSRNSTRINNPRVTRHRKLLESNKMTDLFLVYWITKVKGFPLNEKMTTKSRPSHPSGCLLIYHQHFLGLMLQTWG